MRSANALAKEFNHRWYCHSACPADDDDPFPLRGLVIKDILREAYEPEHAPRIRIGPHTSGSQLLFFARRRPHSWANACAHAKYKAALLRGEENLSGFESDPFKFDVGEWLSHAPVTFQWKWYEQGWKTELVEVMVNDVGL